MAKLNDIEIDDLLAQCVQVEPLALQEEFVRWTGDYCYWNEKFARASRLHASCKQERDKISASLTLEIWATAEAAVQAAAAAPLDPAKKAAKPPKLPTVGEVEARMQNDPTYQAAKGAESDAEIEMERLNGVLQALRGKKDMIVQMAYHQRAEMAGDPVLRDYMKQDSRG